MSTKMFLPVKIHGSFNLRDTFSFSFGMFLKRSFEIKMFRGTLGSAFSTLKPLKTTNYYTLCSVR